MKKFQLYVLLSLFLIGWIFPSTTLACACCAERGHYSVRTTKPTEYELEELQKLQFQTAELYTDAGYPDTIKGINPLGESFSVKGLLDGKTWAFDFKDNTGQTGKLNLTKPLSMEQFMADLPGGEESETSMVSLYKEWRFEYRVQNATGIFKKGFAPSSRYFLVLQGSGNFCTSADDFTKWRLEVSGRRFDFAFFGSVNAGS